MAESAGRGDHGPRRERAAVGELHFEAGVAVLYAGDPMSGADVRVQAGGVPGEVGGDLVPVRVAVRIAGNGNPGREL